MVDLILTQLINLKYTRHDKQHQNEFKDKSIYLQLIYLYGFIS
jgi:hypothetical protein